MTAPAVGTIVFYTPGKDEPISTENAAGLPAIVVSTRTVNDNDMVTLVVFDSSGKVHARNNVSLPVIAEGETEPPVMGPYYMDALRDITPPEPVAPELTSLSPTAARIGSADIELECAGTGFTPATVITFNGGDEVTRYYSAEMITTIVKPSTATVAGDYPVTVKNGELESAPLTFTFEAADAPPPPEADPESETEPEGETLSKTKGRSKR